GHKPLITLLHYPESETALQRTINLQPPSRKEGRIRIAVVGAGGVAQSMHLPNLVKLRGDFEMRCVMSRTGANARGAASSYQAGYATSDYEQVLSDPEIDLVLIATRHQLHGSMVLKALRAGKHVFVEKPLTIFPDELKAIEDFYGGQGNRPLLMTGFN